jgi:hypothetical protein
MIVSELIQVASREFERKMSEFGQNWKTDRLTAPLAKQVRIALREAFSHASRQAYKSFVESYEVQDSQIEWQGHQLRCKAVSPKTFLTSFGTISLDRRLYQADPGGPSHVPLDHLWEMDGHFATEEVRQGVCFAMAHMTAEEAAQLLSLCSLFQPSATAIQHIVEKVSAEIEPHQEALDTTIRGSIETPPETKVLVASLDGANVLLREPGVRRGRPSERPRSPEPEEPKNATYKNAMVEAISFYGAMPADSEGPERLRSLYSARMPQDRAVTFKQDFERHLAIIESQLDPQVIKLLLCDGHRALWNYADHCERFDSYEKLVDFYHTDEHLSRAAEALFGKNSPQGERWYTKYRGVLLEQDDGVQAVRRSLWYYGRTRRLGPHRRKAWATERTFFRRNQQRMTYAAFRRRGLPIGSGPVEAACKSIVKTRLCRSGMRWSRAGGQRILNFRCYVKSGVWNEFWETYQQLRCSA